MTICLTSHLINITANNLVVMTLIIKKYYLMLHHLTCLQGIKTTISRKVEYTFSKWMKSRQFIATLLTYHGICH